MQGVDTFMHTWLASAYRNPVHYGL